MQYGWADRWEGVTGSAIRKIFALLADPEIISFAGGNPDPETFPKEALSRIAAELIASEGDSILQYGGTAGTDEYLSVLVDKYRGEGLSAELKNVIALTGSSQGIELLTKAFINPGDVILTESPTFLGALQTFKLYQAKTVGVEMDAQGMLMEDLEAKLREYRPKFIYTIPTFQNPTGRTLPAERRKQMVELAEKYGAVILEDDPYGELRFAGEPQPSIKSFDKNGTVVKLTSFSKTVSPGLRVGGMLANEDIIAKVNMGKQGADVHTSNLNQAMVARYIKEGLYAGGVEKNAKLYAKKAKTMLEAAAEFFPESAKIVPPEGGMFMWVDLPEGVSATELFPKAVEAKVAYVTGTPFYPDGGHDNTFRLNYTMVDEARIIRGMEILGGLLRRV